MIKDYIQALRDGKGYQWICDHGHELSKIELCDIIREFNYSACSIRYCGEEAEDLCNEIADSLADIYEEEDN